MPLLWLFSLKFLIILTIFWYLCQSLSHHHITQSICFVINIISFRRLIDGLRYVIYVSWEYWTYQCFGSVSFTLLSDRWSCWSPGPSNTSFFAALRQIRSICRPVSNNYSKPVLLSVLCLHWYCRDWSSDRVVLPSSVYQPCCCIEHRLAPIKHVLGKTSVLLKWRLAKGHEAYEGEEDGKMDVKPASVALP